MQINFSLSVNGYISATVSPGRRSQGVQAGGAGHARSPFVPVTTVCRWRPRLPDTGQWRGRQAVPRAEASPRPVGRGAACDALRLGSANGATGRCCCGPEMATPAQSPGGVCRAGVRRCYGRAARSSPEWVELPGRTGRGSRTGAETSKAPRRGEGSLGQGRSQQDRPGNPRGGTGVGVPVCRVGQIRLTVSGPVRPAGRRV